MPVPGRDSRLHAGDTQENEMGGGAGGFPGYPVGCALPGEGELAAATLLQLPPGNEEGDLLREFVVEGNKQWARWPVSSPGTNQGPGSPVS